MINNGLAPPNPPNVIDYQIEDFVYVRNVGCGVPNPADPCASPGGPTTVELAEGGSSYEVQVRDTSSLWVTGGSGAVSARDSSTVIMTGGGGPLFHLTLGGTSTGNLTGGETHNLVITDSSMASLAGIVTEGFSVSGSANVSMTAGGAYGSSISDSAVLSLSGSSGLYALSARDNSSTTLSAGGYIGSVGVSQSANFILDGGTIGSYFSTYDSADILLTAGDVGDELLTYGTSIIEWKGGTGSFFVGASDSSVITLWGSDFEVDGVPAPYGELEALTGTLTGTLLSGDTIDFEFRQGGYDSGSYQWDGTIVVAPEPTTALLVGLGLVGMGVRRRREIQKEEI
jgi:hypothetical protein